MAEKISNFNIKNILLFLFFNIIFTIFYFAYINFSSFSIFSSDDLSGDLFSFSEKLKLFFLGLFDISFLYNFLSLFLFIFFILSFSLLFTLFTLLWQMTKKINTKKSFWSFLGMFIAILGIHCIACGAGILLSILSLFGIVTVSQYFPLNGQEFTILGLIIINIMNYLFYKRLKNPTTCN